MREMGMIGSVYEQSDERWMALVVAVDPYSDDVTIDYPLATILILWDEDQPKCEGTFESIRVFTLTSTCTRVE
jgi:hypothetical protein